MNIKFTTNLICYVLQRKSFVTCRASAIKGTKSFINHRPCKNSLGCLYFSYQILAFQVGRCFLHICHGPNGELSITLCHIYYIDIITVIKPPQMKFGGYIGITLSVRLSVQSKLNLAITFQLKELRLSNFTCVFHVTTPFSPYLSQILTL